MLFSGRVAIVAGLAGVGPAVARALAREGAAVVLGDPDDAARRAAHTEVAALGGTARSVATGRGARADGEALVQAALEAFGRLDVLVTNAARPDTAAPFAGADLDEWRQHLEATLFATLETVRAAIPPLRAADGGAIVFVNAPDLRDPAAAHGADAAASGALLSAAQALARELGPSSIRVNSIVPRPLSHAARVAPTAATRASDAAADATVFLASDLAAAVTGQSLDVQTSRT